MTLNILYNGSYLVSYYGDRYNDYYIWQNRCGEVVRIEVFPVNG